MARADLECAGLAALWNDTLRVALRRGASAARLAAGSVARRVSRDRCAGYKSAAGPAHSKSAFAIGLAFLFALCPLPVAFAQLPDETLKQVRWEQRIDAHVPLDVPFRDETGRPVTLGEYFGKKPVMLVQIQYRCTMLCTEQMNILKASLKQLGFTPGKEFTLLVASIDPRESAELAAEVKSHTLQEYGRHGAERGWHYLTGDKPAIDRLADATGYHYAYDRKKDQFAHPDGVMVLTPEGKIARYFFRLEYPARSLRLALVEAAAGKIGTPLDALALLCYHYDPLTGTYSLALLSVVRLAGIVTVVLMVLSILVLRRRERRRSANCSEFRVQGSDPTDRTDPTDRSDQVGSGSGSILNPEPGTLNSSPGV